MIKENEVCVGKKTILVKNLLKNSHAKITAICDICSKESVISFQKYNINYNKYNLYTCHFCSSIKNKKTNLIRYGVEIPLQNNDIYNKLIQTNIDKYGVVNVFQNESIKEKIKETNFKNLGVDYPQQNKEVFKKSRKTCLEKYGFERASQNQEVINKMKSTKDEKYGYSGYNNIEKIKRTCLEKYGVDNVGKLDIHKEKSREYNENKILSKYKFIKKIDYNNRNYLCDCNKGHEYTIRIDLFHNRLWHKINTCTLCYPEQSLSSDKENQLLNFIKENYNGEILSNDRIILNGKELDIYLPELKLSFEYNGLYWHSNLFKSDDYHINKINDCKNRGVNLIYIWEDDWIYDNEKTKDTVIKLLNQTPYELEEQNIYSVIGNKRIKYDEKLNVPYFYDGGKLIFKNV